MGRRETAEEFRERRKKKRGEDNRRVMRMTTLILQLGISMMTCIFLCGIPGYFLAGHTGHPVIFPLFLLLGVLSGFRSCYQVIERFNGRLITGRKPEGQEGQPDMAPGRQPDMEPGRQPDTKPDRKPDSQKGAQVPEAGGEDEDELDEDPWI